MLVITAPQKSSGRSINLEIIIIKKNPIITDKIILKKNDLEKKQN